MTDEKNTGSRPRRAAVAAQHRLEVPASLLEAIGHVERHRTTADEFLRVLDAINAGHLSRI